MASIDQIIRMAINTACAGVDPNSALYQKLTLEADTMTDQALHALSAELAVNRDIQARLSKIFVPGATGPGIFDVPATMLIEYLREGSVRDSSVSPNDSTGVLHKVANYNDFIGYLSPLFNYYHVRGSSNSGVVQIYTRGIASAVIAAIQVDCAYVPTKADLNAAISDEILDDLVVKLALRLRGFIAGMPTEQAA